MMKAIVDDTTWAEAQLDIPFGSISPSSSPTEAMTKPGCFVISHEKDPKNHRWPKLWAKVVKFDKDADQVVLASTENYHREGNPRTVWTGTVSEFYRMWQAD